MPALVFQSLSAIFATPPKRSFAARVQSLSRWVLDDSVSSDSSAPSIVSVTFDLVRVCGPLKENTP